MLDILGRFIALCRGFRPKGRAVVAARVPETNAARYPGLADRLRSMGRG